MSFPATTAAAGQPRVLLPLMLLGGALVGVLVGLAMTVTLGTTPGIVEPGMAVVVGLPLSRAMIDVAALVTLGMSILPKLLGDDRPRRIAGTLDLARRAAAISAAVWVIAALSSLVLETADVNPGLPVTIASITTHVRTIASGQALVIVAACTLVYLVIAVVAVCRGETIPAELRITVATFAILPLPVTGHAANGSGWQDINVIAMELHVLGAVAWTGGLFAVIVLLATNRSLLAGALPRFSTLATVCIFLIAATGLFNGWLELYRTPNVHWYLAVFNTGYGLILIGKMLCILAAGLLGAHVRVKLMPKIVSRQPTAVATWTAVELGVLGGAFGLAVVLIRAPVVGIG